MVIAFTSEPAVRSELALTWGVETFVCSLPLNVDDAVAQAEETMLRLGRAQPGERAVIVAGQPGRAGSTNTVRVHELGSSPGNDRAA